MNNAEEIRKRKNSHDFLGKLSGLEEEDRFTHSFSLLPSTLVTTTATTTTATTTTILTMVPTTTTTTTTMATPTIRLTLSLHPANADAIPLPSPPPPPPPPTPSTSVTTVHRHEAGPGPSRMVRARRNPTQLPREEKSDTVPAPFPWATSHLATVHSLNYLLSRQIYSITGEVQCKFCEQENNAKPVISEKKKSINWLFLLLGQMIGCCTLEQLKYFCKHTKNHRTGAKDRVLYLTYLGLCKQLDPNGPFDR
ncbi:hypothetical protein TEA_012074 [Camellia sinensis var. sinensis]|uniref:DUF7086 domain-containing protein n=1 Tax=Camellia sinensis var. sinensis TaxID=542762 RepID=A0A4S4DKW4_CAMSN|nr:hypothetical protein TEA_012074 [Camellia sinensis var. sinensis]